MGWLMQRTDKANASVDIAAPAFKANPYPFYARLRAESPVQPVPLPGGRTAWLVTRYDDVAAVLKDDRFTKDKLALLKGGLFRQRVWVPRVFLPLLRNMLDMDPPGHTRLRGLVQKAFTPGLVEQMRGRVQALADELLDKIQGRGRMDLIRDFALPLPSTIIAEMLGVPAADQHKFHHWSKTILTLNSARWGHIRLIPTVWRFLNYLRRLVRARRGDLRDDLVSALIRVEEGGEGLSEDELLAMIFLLLVAGHETTVNLIGSGTLALLEHPDQLARLRDDPALLRTGVEELLRYTSPAETASSRFTREDMTMAETTIPRGSMVLAVIASANRDESHFPNADKLDVGREPNKHLAFGQGIHFCLGAPLARMEGQIAIGTLLRRLPDLRLAVAPGALRWRRGLIVRGLEALPVAFGGRVARA